MRSERGTEERGSTGWNGMGTGLSSCWEHETGTGGWRQLRPSRPGNQSAGGPDAGEGWGGGGESHPGA